MNSKVAALTVLFLLAASSVAFAQGVEESTYKAFGPLEGLIKALVRMGWDLTELIIGKDDAEIAYFTTQLGFRDVTFENTPTDGGEQDCLVSSFRIIDDRVVCRNTEGELYNVTDGTNKLNVSNINDYDDSGNVDLADVFRYMTKNDFGTLNVPDSAKGQVMLFALLIPMGILTYLLIDFFASSGLLRYQTSAVVSLGIALLAVRSGVYPGLLSMISQIFGAGGFFLSMLSVYLIIAILLWFYGGIRKAKAIAEAEDKVRDAVVEGFSYDLLRGLVGKEAAGQLAGKKNE